MKDYNFPKDFLWGVATAAHQVEGNNINSDIWLMEQLPNTMYQEHSGDACDFYHLYEKDIDLLAELGFNSFRFSIEWARVEPIDGEFSQAEIDHYGRIIDYMLVRDIEPVITLHHFTTPQWIIRQGGWSNMETAIKFARYAEKMIEVFGERVTWWSTINEANTPLQLSINGLVTGDFTGDLKSASAAAAPYFGVDVEDFAPFFANAREEHMILVVIEAHRLAVEKMKQANQNIKVGVTLSLQDIQVINDSPEGIEVLETINKRFLRDMGTVGDYVGVQTYTTVRYDEQGRINDTENLSNAGVVMNPESLANTVRLAHDMTQKPIMVTEHGADLPNERDDERITFVEDSLIELHKLMNDDIEVLGYQHWSYLDNYEWFRGYQGQFGVVGVDFETQERFPKKSAYALGTISRENKVSK